MIKKRVSQMGEKLSIYLKEALKLGVMFVLHNVYDNLIETYSLNSLSKALSVKRGRSTCI